MSSRIAHLHIALRQALSLNWKLTVWCWEMVELQPCVAMPRALVGARDVNSGPCVCRIRALAL